jgi:hypothetical protein
MKPTKITNFSYTFYGPMTRQLFELGVLDTLDSPGHLGVGSGKSRSLAATRAIGGFRHTPAVALIEQITDRIQMNLQPEWAVWEGDEIDGTEMFCVIEVEAE